MNARGEHAAHGSLQRSCVTRLLRIVAVTSDEGSLRTRLEGALDKINWHHQPKLPRAE